jgi:hypothetical protein
VPDVDVSVGIGQGGGNEDLSGHACVLQSESVCVGRAFCAGGSVRSDGDCVNMPTFGEQQLPENQG